VTGIGGDQEWEILLQQRGVSCKWYLKKGFEKTTTL